MPTTITSAGVTFTDTTTLTSANIGTAQLVNGSVTAAKLGTTEQKQIAKAWVNFDGTTTSANLAGTYSQSGTTVTITTSTAHGLSQGQGIYTNFTTGAGVDGVFTVASITSPTVFTYTAATSLTTSGNVTLNRSSIRSQYNVSSITKNAIGNYTINFTTAMTDANYSAIGFSSVGTNGTRITYLSLDASPTPNINYFTVSNYPSGDGTGGKDDTSIINIQVFGN